MDLDDVTRVGRKVLEVSERILLTPTLPWVAQARRLMWNI